MTDKILVKGCTGRWNISVILCWYNFLVAGGNATKNPEEGAGAMIQLGQYLLYKQENAKVSLALVALANSRFRGSVWK